MTIHMRRFHLFLCVWMMWSDCGWSFGQSANFDFAKEVKLHVWHYQVEDAV